MKYSKDDVIKALELCSLSGGSSSCEGCPLKEECEENPLESILAKYTLEVVNKLLHENKALTEQRDTFREYALKMHALIENIKIKENEGYEFSVAKHAAYMDMWRVIASEKRALQDENKRLLERLRIKNLEESKNVIH